MGDDDDLQVRVWAARAVLCAADLDARREVMRDVIESEYCPECFVHELLDLVATITTDANIGALEGHLLALLDGVEPSQ